MFEEIIWRRCSHGTMALVTFLYVWCVAAFSTDKMPFDAFQRRTDTIKQPNKLVWFFFCSPKVIEMCLNNYYLSFTEMRVQHKENSVTIKLVDGTNGRRRFPNGDCFCLFLKTPQIIKRKICIYCFNAGHLLHIYF